MRTRTLAVLVMLGVSVAGLLMVNRYIAAQPSVSEEKEQKWEYCRIYSTYLKDGKYITMVRFPSTPQSRIEEIDSSADGLVALNKLGAEGWELVMTIRTNSNPAEFLLKRRR